MPVITDTGKNDAKKNDLVIVDLGSKKRKQVKDLRKGKGKLMEKVHQAIEELKASNTISGSVQPIVIIVKEKGDIRSMLGGFMGK